MKSEARIWDGTENNLFKSAKRSLGIEPKLILYKGIEEKIES